VNRGQTRRNSVPAVTPRAAEGPVRRSRGPRAQAKQPAAWVSGFYGSGKPHLIRVLEYLCRGWVGRHRASGGAAAPRCASRQRAEHHVNLVLVAPDGQILALSVPARADPLGIFVSVGSR
jgi:hypothetical protein